jgi:hypothetical protein
MADDDRRPSLEAPKLFGRRRPRPEPSGPAEPVFEDAGESPAETTVVLEEPVEVVEPVEDARPRPKRRERRPPPARPSLPTLPGWAAAVLGGLAAGLGLVVLTWLGFRGCEAVRGTSSCGTGPGMVALVLVVVLAVVLGGVVLRALKVPDPVLTSFLGTGMTGIVCLLFLVDQLDHWSMVLAVPAITVATFLVSWKVTTTYVDPE